VSDQPRILPIHLSSYLSDLPAFAFSLCSEADGVTFTDMSTLADIEDAVRKLSVTQKLQLLNFISEEVVSAEAPAQGNKGHSILDIPVVSLGGILSPPSDDLSGEMLEDRI
jgi:hypothetical protein